MNIIIYTFPFRGHTMQAIIIAEYLNKKGHHVSVDTNPSFFKYISPNIKKIECLYKFTQFTNNNKKDNLLNWAEGVFVTTREYANNFRKNVDLIVFDSMAYWGKYIAEKYNIPSVSLMTIQPFTSEQFYDCAYKLLLKKYISKIDSHEKIMRKMHIYQVVAKKKFDLPDNFSFDDFLCARGDKNIVLLPKSLCKFLDGLEDSYMSFSPVIEYGDSVFQKDDSIYIATGSMISDIDLLTSCIETLLPYNRTIHISSGRYTRQLKNKYSNYSDIHFYEFAPQMKLLKQASIFITHGGSNSVCESILAKTPMIVIPLENDEFLNAEMIVACGIGIRVDNDIDVIRNTLGDLCETLSEKFDTKQIDAIAKEINPNNVWRIFDKITGDYADVKI